MGTPFAIYDALSAIAIPPEKVRVVVQSMERDMALFATRSQFSALDAHSSASFDLLRAEIAGVRERAASFREQIDRRFDRMHSEMLAMERRIEQRLTLRLGAFLTVAVTVTATIVKLLSR